jgi:hypothetical protein
LRQISRNFCLFSALVNPLPKNRLQRGRSTGKCCLSKNLSELRSAPEFLGVATVFVFGLLEVFDVSAKGYHQAFLPFQRLLSFLEKRQAYGLGISARGLFFSASGAIATGP